MSGIDYRADTIAPTERAAEYGRRTTRCGAERAPDSSSDDCGCGWGYLCRYGPDGREKVWQVRFRHAGMDRADQFYVTELEDRLQLEERLIARADGLKWSITVWCNWKVSGTRSN